MNSILVFFIVSVYAVLANAVACTTNQLAGISNSFRFTGGGGTFNPGTAQVVSFDHPTGSSVLTLTAISIIKISDGSSIVPFITSGIPTQFNVNGPDSSAIVNLVLPNNLPSGTFLYRASLSTTSGICTLDSIPFTSTGISNQNQCQTGQSRCQSANSFVTCISSPSGNIFGGTITQCTGGQACVQTGNVAVCTFSNPSTCSLGAFRCAGTGFQQCFQGALGNMWTSTQQCAQGTSCVLSGNNISCLPINTGSVNQCVQGEKRCVSQSQFQVCILDPSGSGKLIWGNQQICSSGTSCTGSGQCTLGNPIECTPGYMKCEGNDWRQCTQSSTGIWQFSEKRVCPTGTSCSQYLENYIICK